MVCSLFKPSQPWKNLRHSNVSFLTYGPFSQHHTTVISNSSKFEIQRVKVFYWQKHSIQFMVVSSTLNVLQKQLSKEWRGLLSIGLVSRQWFLLMHTSIMDILYLQGDEYLQEIYLLPCGRAQNYEAPWSHGLIQAIQPEHQWKPYCYRKQAEEVNKWPCERNSLYYQFQLNYIYEYLLFCYLHIQREELFSVYICIWVIFWGPDPDVSTVNQTNDARESPFVFKAGSYGELFICCKTIVKVTSLQIYLLLALLCDWLKKLTIRPSDKLTWKINCRLWYSLQNPVHATQCNVEPVCHCSSRLLVSHTPEES